jgi:hypothetical protein
LDENSPTDFAGETVLDFLIDVRHSMTENENARRSFFFLLATRPGFDQNIFASHELPM